MRRKHKVGGVHQMEVDAESEVLLGSSQFTDSISCAKFCKNEGKGNFLLCSSWDRSVCLFDTDFNTFRTRYHHPAAVLSCCFDEGQDGLKCFSAGLDGTVRYQDLEADKGASLGSHDAPIKTVCFSPEKQVAVTGSWDCTLKTWDPRTSKEVDCVKQPNKVFAMDCMNEKVLVAHAGRTISLYDVRKFDEPIFEKNSSLSHQTRSIRLFDRGYILGSIAGRVTVDYFDEESFKFKCHRRDDRIFPVNAVVVHPVHGTFATGGCDGLVITWDPFRKKRISVLSRYQNSIADLDFDRTGGRLAIAVSYTFEEGEDVAKMDMTKQGIILKQVKQNQVARKENKE